MKHDKYNYLGKPIDDVEERFADPSFYTIDSEGKKTPLWTKENEFVDGNGFDKNFFEPNGCYWQEVDLPVGKILARYRSPQGRLTTDKGTPYEKLGLPYDPETLEYHEYKVVADGAKAKCTVRRGHVYRMFNSPGGAVQYLHPQSLYKEVADGKLEEVFSWKK